MTYMTQNDLYDSKWLMTQNDTCESYDSPWLIVTSMTQDSGYNQKSKISKYLANGGWLDILIPEAYEVWDNETQWGMWVI